MNVKTEKQLYQPWYYIAIFAATSCQYQQILYWTEHRELGKTAEYMQLFSIMRWVKAKEQRGATCP